MSTAWHLKGEGVSATLGEWCEVVVHDLRDMDHSIVYISGNAAARKVGGHMTDLGLANTRSGRAELLMNCTAYSDDCKTVKSSSIFVHDETGKPVEARYSLLFERHALHTDSAGAGKYRGWIRCD